MGDTFAISALRRKRARLAGEIEAVERDLAKQRGTLATLDAVLRLFEPQGNPELIASIRPVSRRCLYFRHGELTRLCADALREGRKPMPCRDIALYAMVQKGLEGVDPRIRTQITEQVRTALVRLAHKGIVRKIVDWPETWWELAA